MKELTQWYKVVIQWENDEIVDEIQGSSPENAWDNAEWNWPDASHIQLIED